MFSSFPSEPSKALNRATNWICFKPLTRKTTRAWWCSRTKKRLAKSCWTLSRTKKAKRITRATPLCRAGGRLSRRRRSGLICEMGRAGCPGAASDRDGQLMHSPGTPPEMGTNVTENPLTTETRGPSGHELRFADETRLLSPWEDAPEVSFIVQCRQGRRRSLRKKLQLKWLKTNNLAGLTGATN